jgi:hypothetical protein
MTPERDNRINKGVFKNNMIMSKIEIKYDIEVKGSLTVGGITGNIDFHFVSPESAVKADLVKALEKAVDEKIACLEGN